MAAFPAYLVLESWTGSYLATALKQSALTGKRFSLTNYPSPTTIFTCLLVLLPSLYILYKIILKMATPTPQPSKLFPFLDLPAELREMVYENLIEDPHYPAQGRCAKHAGTFVANFLGHEWGWQTKRTMQERRSNWIFLANRQIYEEYMALLGRKATFFLKVSPENYTHPTVTEAPSAATPTPAPETSQTAAPSSTTASVEDLSPSNLPHQETEPEHPPLWRIAPSTLSRIRRCSLKLITTSAMLGVTDPRTLTPGTWDLAHQVQSELRDVQDVKELNLHVKAVGDPLWNPMWVWYHALTSFFRMGEDVGVDAISDEYSSGEGSDGDTGLVKKDSGPRISKILFSLDTWSPGENYLARDGEGKWGWCCIKGHRVFEEVDVDLTVRQFCHRLYIECPTCQGPEAGSEAEEGGAN